MNNRDYEDLYHKYKNKYLTLKGRQSGGNLIYNPFICQRKLIKQVQRGERLEYENIKGRSNIFSHEQQNDINAFTNFIMPFYKDSNGALLGSDSIKELSFLSAGSFGVTMYFRDILFKILKIDFKNVRVISEEIKISSFLFINKENGSRLNPPVQINKIYGYLTSNKIVHELVSSEYPVILDPAYKQMSLYTNLPQHWLDPADIQNAIKDLEGYNDMKTNVMNGNIAILILEKADVSLKEYHEIFKTKTLQSPILDGFISDMYKGLYYINIIKKSIHNDIKPDNIVVKYRENELVPLFQLIDFGLLQVLPIDDQYSNGNININTDNISDIDTNSIPDTDIIIDGGARDIIRAHGGTPQFFKGSPFEETRSILYDWHCVYIIVLILLDLIVFREGKLFYIEGNMSINVNDYNNYTAIAEWLKKKVGEINEDKIPTERKSRLLNILACLAGVKFYHELIQKDGVYTFVFLQIGENKTVSSVDDFVYFLGEIIGLDMANV